MNTGQEILRKFCPFARDIILPALKNLKVYSNGYDICAVDDLMDNAIANWNMLVKRDMYNAAADQLKYFLDNRVLHSDCVELANIFLASFKQK